MGAHIRITDAYTIELPNKKCPFYDVLEDGAIIGWYSTLEGALHGVANAITQRRQAKALQYEAETADHRNWA